MKQLLVVLVSLVLVILVGCGTQAAGTSTTPAAGGTNSAACHGVSTINHALSSLSTAGDHITVAKARTIQTGLTVALSGVQKVAPAGSSATLTQLASANQQLGQSLADLPAGDTLSQHAQQLQQFKTQVAKAQAATQQLSGKLNCSA